MTLAERRRRIAGAAGLVVGLVACGPNAYESWLRVDPARECSGVEQLFADSDLPAPHMSRTLWRVHACPEAAGGFAAGMLLGIRAERDSGVMDVRRAAGHARDYPKARQLGER